MMRLPGWEGRLYALEQRKRWLEFDWGAHDCCTWAASAVEALTGQPISMPGPYESGRQANRIIKQLGGLQAAVTGLLGVQPYAPHFAQRGDIVLLRQSKSHALAVCFGTFAYAPGEDGLVATQMKSPDVLAVWHIGH